MKTFFRSSALVLVFSFILSPLGISAQEEPTSYPVSFPSDEIVEDEIVEQTPDTEEDVTEPLAEELDVGSREFNLPLRSEELTNQKGNMFFVRFKEGTNSEQIEAVGSEVLGEDISIDRPTGLELAGVQPIKIAEDEDAEAKLEDLRADPNVETVLPNQIYKMTTWSTTSTTAKPSDHNDANHWNLNQIRLPELYKLQDCENDGALCGGSSSLIVAVLDTGLAFEDYNAVYEFYGDNYNLNFTRSAQVPMASLWTNPNEDIDGGDEDGNGICDDLHGADMVQLEESIYESNWTNRCNAAETDVQKEGHPNDDEGHGTFVAGIISAAVDDGAGSSYGIAHNVKIMPIKVLDYEGYGTSFTIYRGIRYAVDKGAKVINMSLAGGGADPLIQDALNYARNNGVVVVIASGNGNYSSVEYPGAYSSMFDNVVSVGSVTSSNVKANYASYGSGLTLVAPVGNGASAGNGVWGSTFTNYATFPSTPLGSRNFSSFSMRYGIGTSYSAPQVAAAAAVLKSKMPSYTASYLKYLLTVSAKDINTPGWDSATGYGLLDTVSLWETTWSSIELNGGNDGAGIYTVEFNNKLLQFTVTYGRNWMRSSDDGVTWTNWEWSGGNDGAGIYLKEFNGRLFQSVISGHGNWTRSTTDGTTWTDWTGSGGNDGMGIYFVEFNGKLFQAVISAGRNWMRSTSDGTTWTNWEWSGGNDRVGIYFIEFNSKLYEFIISGGVNWMRSTVDGTTWTGWTWSGGNDGVGIYLTEFNGRLIESIISGQGNWTRSTADGTTWSNWAWSGGNDRKGIFFAEYNNELFQAVISGGANWIRSTTDGVTWSGWTPSGGNDGKGIYFTNYDGKLFESIISGNRTWVRYLSGSTWSNWLDNGNSNGKGVYNYIFNDLLYQGTVFNGINQFRSYVK